MGSLRTLSANVEDDRKERERAMTTLRIRVAMCVAGLLVLGACTTTIPLRDAQPLSEAERQTLGAVQIEPVYEGRTKTQGINPGKGAGVAMGAGGAALGWAGASLSTGEPITALVGLMLTPVAALGGGIYGGIVADKAEDVEHYRATLARVVDTAPQVYARELEGGVRQLVDIPVTVAPATSPPSQMPQMPEEIDATLRIEFASLVGSGGGPESMLEFKLSTQTQLIPKGAVKPTYTRSYSVTTRSQRLSEWVTDDGAPLRGALDRLASSTVEQILDDHFRRSALVVKPVFPARPGVFKPRRLKTASPIFSWALLDSGVEVDGEKYSELSYEMRLVDDHGTSIVARDLPSPAYEHDTALRQCATYRWNARASYRSFGQTRATAWSQERAFRTPCPKGAVASR